MQRESQVKTVQIDPIETLQRTIGLIGRRIEAEQNLDLAKKNRGEVSKKYTAEISKVNRTDLFKALIEAPNTKNAEALKKEDERRRGVVQRRSKDETYKDASKRVRVARQVHEITVADENGFYDSALKGLRFD